MNPPKVVVARMDSDVLSYVSKLIWIGGCLFFTAMSFPNLWGTLVFLFDSFNGLFLDLEPKAKHAANAKVAGVKLLSTMVLCIVLQLIVFAIPFVLTQSANLIQYYEDREKGYLKAISGRLELAKKLTETDEQVKAMSAEVYQCRQQIQLLNQECAALAKAVSLSRQSLSEQITKTSNLNNKGDF